MSQSATFSLEFCPFQNASCQLLLLESSSFELNTFYFFAIAVELCWSSISINSLAIRIISSIKHSSSTFLEQYYSIGILIIFVRETRIVFVKNTTNAPKFVLDTCENSCSSQKIGPKASRFLPTKFCENLLNWKTTVPFFSFGTNEILKQSQNVSLAIMLISVDFPYHKSQLLWAWFHRSRCQPAAISEGFSIGKIKNFVPEIGIKFVQNSQKIHSFWIIFLWKVTPLTFYWPEWNVLTFWESRCGY